MNFFLNRNQYAFWHNIYVLLRVDLENGSIHVKSTNFLTINLSRDSSYFLKTHTKCFSECQMENPEIFCPKVKWLLRYSLTQQPMHVSKNELK